MNIKNMALY